MQLLGFNAKRGFESVPLESPCPKFQPSTNLSDLPSSVQLDIRVVTCVVVGDCRISHYFSSSARPEEVDFAVDFRGLPIVSSLCESASLLSFLPLPCKALDEQAEAQTEAESGSGAQAGLAGF